MAGDPIDMLREGFERFNETREIPTEMLDEQVEWGLWSGSPQGDLMRGHEGVREWAREMEESFEHLRIEPDEFEQLDADRVLVVSRMIGRGRGSQIEVEAPLVTVWTFRDGRVVALRSFSSREQALAESAGG